MPLLDPSWPILLVEDDEVDILNVQRAFAKTNFLNPLYIAKNGLEAINKLKGTNNESAFSPTPKIILLDINMPKMTGIEFLKNIRQDDTLKSLLVFMLTSSDNDRDKIAAYNLHVAGYILKPLRFEDFIKTLSALTHYWNLLEFPDGTTLKDVYAK